MYKLRCWLFKHMWYLTMKVAPVEVRAVAQKTVDLGMTQMEKEQDNLEREN